ncbi:lytic transglycosylase domain-containing protein [Alteromonas flava]|uniref:lytic transglycosylase domain-containing protein n=1 Tax=Alteromonas flava TaxID=2048003 RepID=UPI000C291B25|nr:lytic transglycosylase domain-containing protein [Alteromonas flava]
MKFAETHAKSCYSMFMQRLLLVASMLRISRVKSLKLAGLYRLFFVSIAWHSLVLAADNPIVSFPQSPLVAAVDPFSTADTERFREQFDEFVTIIRTQRNIDATDMQARLHALEGYTLYPYAWKYWLLASLSRQSEAQIGEFLTRYDGQPVARNVRKRWLQLLQDQNANQAFVHDYHAGLSAELDCYYLRQTLPEDVDAEVLDSSVAKLWMVPYSQPSACDPLFARWKKAGLQTSERTLKRVKLATQEGNYRLASFLARSLKPQHKYLAQLWRDAQRNPARLTNAKRLPMQYLLQEGEAFTYAMKKLAWSQPQKVITAYQTFADGLQLSEQQREDIVSAIALSLAVDQHPDALSWLQKAQEFNVNEEILRWQVATSIRQQQWQQTLAIIEQASELAAQDISYEYWMGRSWQQLQVEEKATERFNNAAQERHYYGFLASAQLDRPAQFNHREPIWDAQIQTLLLSDPAINRAFELKRSERFAEARREWRFALQAMSPEIKIQAALLAHHWGWFDQAIQLFTELNYMDDVVRRFPVPSESPLQPLATEYQVDPAWALAITRRESSFMVDAVSQVGARGLMQIMPTTANYLAKQPVNYSALLEPERNISLGLRYLQYLMQKVDNNPVLATASYNAGWQRVLNWLPKQEAQDADIWIESIPYRETRNYVKAVLAYKYIYQRQLGLETDVFEQLQHMQMSPKQ